MVCSSGTHGRMRLGSCLPSKLLSRFKETLYVWTVPGIWQTPNKLPFMHCFLPAPSSFPSILRPEADMGPLGIITWRMGVEGPPFASPLPRTGAKPSWQVQTVAWKKETEPPRPQQERGFRKTTHSSYVPRVAFLTND